MTARLPTPGADSGAWGDVLNAFLQVGHDSTGRNTAVAPSVTPNASPQNSEAWFSSSLIYSGVEASPAKRFQIGLSGSWQEPSVWYANGQFNMLYTNGAAHLAYTYCTTDPTVATNWSAPVEVIGGSAGGWSGAAAHSYVYIEGGTLYCYFVDTATQNTRVATAAITAPTTWAQVGIVLGPQGLGTNGNVCVVKDGSTYRMFQECLHSDTLPIEGVSHTWQIVMATCSTPTGTFTTVLDPVASLRPTPNASVSGMWIGKEGSTWVAFFHSGPWGRVFPNDIYRATATDISGDNWILTDNGSPVMRRKHRYEVDQIADPYVCQGPNGINYLFYEGCDNTNPTFKMMVAVLNPAWCDWDGFQWKRIQPAYDDTPAYSQRHKPKFIQNAPAASPKGVVRVGTWTLDASVSPPRRYNSSGAQNDSIQWDVTLDPGNYKLEIWYQMGPTKAIITPYYGDGAGSFNNSPLATIDAYAASLTNYIKATRLLTILGTETFSRRLKFLASTRNASNTTGWEIADHGWAIRDDGFYPDFVINGAFDEGIAGIDQWVPGGTGGVTYSASNGQLSIVRDASGSVLGNPSQVLPLINGKTYKLTCDVAGATVHTTAGSATLTVGTGKTATFTATGSFTLQFWPNANSTTSIISNVSVREVPS